MYLLRFLYINHLMVNTFDQNGHYILSPNFALRMHCGNHPLHGLLLQLASTLFFSFSFIFKLHLYIRLEFTTQMMIAHQRIILGTTNCWCRVLSMMQKSVNVVIPLFNWWIRRYVAPLIPTVSNWNKKSFQFFCPTSNFIPLFALLV